MAICEELKCVLHDLICNDNSTISCKYCGQTTTEDDYDEMHLKSCLGQQKLLYQHQAISSRGLKSDVCERTFHKPLLSVQKKLHQRNKSKTSVMTSSAIAEPSNQSRNEIVEVKRKRLRCDICKKGCSSKKALNSHKRMHSGIGHSVKGHLKNHLRMRTGKKPYQCNTCDTRFTKSSHLTEHMRVHTGEKPYHCNMCDVKFAKSGDLTRHMGVHTGKKPYTCATCGAKFTQSGSLSSHKRVHTGEKPYQCNMCDARFTRSSILIEHMRVHTGEKPYQCDTCSVRFTRSSLLVQHMKLHTGENLFTCSECGYNFTRKGNLKTHMRRQHIKKKQN